MSKALESALLAVARMKAGSEIDPVIWRDILQEMVREMLDAADASNSPPNRN